MARATQSINAMIHNPGCQIAALPKLWLFALEVTFLMQAH
jgi:hypothetical protein